MKAFLGIFPTLKAFPTDGTLSFGEGALVDAFLKNQQVRKMCPNFVLLFLEIRIPEHVQCIVCFNGGTSYNRILKSGFVSCLVEVNAG